MNTLIGGVIGLVLFFLGMTLSNGVGLLLGFIAGVLIRLTLITLQWEPIYALGISGIILCPSLIESNPFVLIGVLVGAFSLEPISQGMKHITTGNDALVHGGRIELENLNRDGRVPTHMYAFYGVLITLLLGVILLLGLSNTLTFLKVIAFPLSTVTTLSMWLWKCWDLVKHKDSKGGGLNVVKLLGGMLLSLTITVISVNTFAESSSNLSVYSVILPLVLMGLPIGKKSELKKEVLPDMLSKNPPIHNDNFTTCVLGGLFASILISTSQRQVIKRFTTCPYDQYGIEAVSTYIQFAFFWILNWGKSGETSVMKVISSFQSLEVFTTVFLLILLCGVLVYTLVFTKEVMTLLIRNKSSNTTKLVGEVVCIAICGLLVISSSNPTIGIFMWGACLMANVLMSKGVIPSEAMMGALLLPYIPFIR